MNSQVLKKKALEKLGNNPFDNRWLVFALITLIFSAGTGAIMSVLYWIAVADTVVTIVLGGITAMIVTALVVRAYRGEEIHMEMIGKYFNKDLWHGILLNFLNSLLIALWTLLFIIPGIIKSISYSMSFFILNENPGMTANEARLASVKLMNGHKLDYFNLWLSFLGWFILSAVCAGIPLFWVIPYFNMAKAAFYDEITNGELSKIPETETAEF